MKTHRIKKEKEKKKKTTGVASLGLFRPGVNQKILNFLPQQKFMFLPLFHQVMHEIARCSSLRYPQSEKIGDVIERWPTGMGDVQRKILQQSVKALYRVKSP